MGIFRRKKEIAELNIEVAAGLRMGRPQDENRRRPFMNCVPKGFFVFFVVFGAMSGFISAFRIECNYVVSGGVLLVTAMYFAGLFGLKKSWHKDVGYIIYFILYIIGIYYFKTYVNSGFAAIANAVRRRGEIYFDLNEGTQFSEKIDDRSLAVTLMVIFIGAFAVILLNIFVSNYMSLKCAVFLTMPLYVIPLYFQSEPNLFFILCMLTGYAGIYMFRNSGHFADGGHGAGYEPETDKKKRKKKKNKNRIPEFSYGQSSRVGWGVLLCAAGCTLVLGGCTLFFNSDDLRQRYVENEYKTATRAGVSGFIMMGFRSFFPNFYSRGGMSGGKLGGFSAIRPDYQTDLVVRFAPYDANPVYLKAYTGMHYRDNAWIDGYRYRGEERGRSEYFLEESAAKEAEQLARRWRAGEEKSARARMDIKNAGADVSYIYYPYVTKFEDYSPYVSANPGVLFNGHGRNKELSYTFYPKLADGGMLTESEAYMYQYVPRENREAVDVFLKEAGISFTDEDAVQKVVNYLKNEYSYSYSPGDVPDGEDFVNYFLTENKKGVCAHFATAAALIFRRLHMPARYVEGYAFDYSEILRGKVREDLRYEDYYQGYSPLGRTGVVELELTDANAHAWVEVYQEGKGWIVVDPTPAVMEDGGSGSNFLSSLMAFLNDSSEGDGSGGISGVNLDFLNSSLLRRAVILLLSLAAICLLLYGILFRVRRWRNWHTASMRKNLLWYYRDMCRRKSKRDEEFRRLSMPSEQLAYLVAERGGTEDVRRLAQSFESICFGPPETEDTPAAKEEYKEVLKALRRCGKRKGTFRAVGKREQ